ncbi:GntR family transcriptional regulator [Micromonospora arida]|uniref:GntR family transcriptional regulator n=1 Tax=Micromonospora arida TaxID=2203715 RepID=A0A3N9XDP2_9ACTN|nr:GntR family transcriptional regulator [Micromonospora arida]RQX05483.1 GntR family transcriptional regulator [Micromonospora arida]
MPPVIPHTAAQIEADLARRIGQREFAPGARLPSYAALSAEYGSARRTVARAIDALKARGLVVGVVGSGVYVAE